MVFKVTDDATLPPLVAKILHESEDKAEQEKRKADRLSIITKAHQRGREEGRAQMADEFKERAKRHRYTVAARKLLQRDLGILLPHDEAGTSRDFPILRLTPRAATWEGDDYILRIDATGQPLAASNPYRLAAIRIRDKTGKIVPTQVIHPTASEEEGIYARITQGRVVRLVMVIEQVAGLKLEELQLEISEPNGARPLIMAIPTHIAATIWRPETPDEERRRLQSMQLIVGPRLFGGAFWVPNGLEEGQGRNTAATTFWGLGIRLLKGFSQSLAFEAEASGGRTGEVAFDLEDGELKRSAKFGRIHIGVALRFSADKVIPTARAGIGVQATTYDSETAGTKPDDGLEFSGLLGVFGGGVDYRFSEHLIGGVALSLVAAEEIQSFEAGVRLGYGWNP